MTIFILTLIFLFITFYAIIFTSFASIKKKTKNNYSENISVVIAAKNEAGNITGLISSLKKINYPKENFEVIIVDDQSDDDTLNILNTECAKLPNFKSVSAIDKKYYGKKGALDLGISKTNYDNILITDADCRPEKEWLSSFSTNLSEGYELIFGAAPFFKKKSFVNKISRFENLRSSILTFAFANLGFSYSAASRSLGFKKKLFEKSGGYSKTLETIGGDDDLFIREAMKNNAKVGIILEQDAFVYSKTETEWRKYFKQKFRHLSTANHYSIKIKFLLALWHFLNIFFLLSPALIIFELNFITLFIVKFFSDIITIKFLQKKMKYNFNFLEVILLQIFYELFLIVNYLGGLFRKKAW